MAGLRGNTTKIHLVVDANGNHVNVDITGRNFAEVVKAIFHLLEELVPNKPLGVSKYEDLVIFVAD